MGKQKLKGKELRKIGFPSDKSKSIAINIMAQHYKHLSKTEILELLKEVLKEPYRFEKHEILGSLAELFIAKVVKNDFTIFKMNEAPKPFKCFGKKFIDQNTIHQMDLAMQLPITVKGSLMPDAHVGYGLPIGGVLATKNEVIPYAIGLDIGCRMAISILDMPVEFLQREKHAIKMALKEETHFGVTKKADRIIDHEVLERKEFGQTELLRTLRHKAIQQIGTSGSGNHFVEFGEVEILDGNQMGLAAGKYVGLVSHSGSRGLGATVANYYKEVAMDKCKLPKGAQHLAWLDLDSEAGQEYWIAMNLAGDYAKACHDVIHHKLIQRLKLKVLTKIENHHNFAWKEKQHDGEELIVHRKGATPAKIGELGFIPGSMTAPGFIVSGKGNPESLNSASHGAGRKYSRTKAKSMITGSQLRQELKKSQVTLIGGGLDEAPNAYKDITEVMKGQMELVNVEGKFIPRIVRMCKP
ncbi:MAG: RtcB family protein [Crocinitomicaceae bacterium]